MKRNTDPRGSLVLAFLLGAFVLHWVALAGGAALVRYFGGFGLADPWGQSEADHTVELALVPEEPFRVVEIERPKVEKVPQETQFRSEFNSDVAKQTAARVRGLHPTAVAMVNRQPPVTPQIVEPQPEPPKKGIAAEPEPDPSPLVMRTPGPKKPKESPDGKRSIWKRKLTLRDLKPTNGVLQKVIPGAFPDYLKDIDQGDQTLLKTKEWKYASFFNRVKRAVAQHWHPDREYTRRDPRGNVYGFKTRTTILHILLHPDGRLKKIVLERPCGLTFLDDEAIQAFKKAAPFPNPPRRLVNKKTQQIAFRFGFIFEILSSPRWRVIRLK
jgi:TonB family protein